jgi:hypothetical protein
LIATAVRSLNHSDPTHRLWRSFAHRHSTNSFLGRQARSLFHRQSNFGWMQPRALHLSSRPVFPPTKSKTRKGRTHLLIPLAIEDQHEHRWCLWRPDHVDFNAVSALDVGAIGSSVIERTPDTLTSGFPTKLIERRRDKSRVMRNSTAAVNKVVLAPSIAAAEPQITDPSVR